jgi:FlgD Ig-like domain
VVLRDPSGSTVDSVAYDPYWHNPDVQETKGRSLERISPSGESNDGRNWSTCALPIGGTPGRPNSLYAHGVPSKAGLVCSPDPFSPDGDGYQDNTVIHLDLPLPVSLISVRIFDSRGRLIRRLVNAEPAGSHGDFVWDGRDDNRALARIGMYVIFVEAMDEGGSLLETTRGVVVLARRLE